MNDSENLFFTGLQAEMDSRVTQFIHSLSPKLIEYIKQQVSRTKMFFIKENSFQLELIVDTNIMFSEVRSLMVNRRSFFLTIVENPLIKVYAPSKLKEELYAKIKLKFPKEKKTREFDLEESYEQADILLSKIEFRDDISQSATDKAYSLLKNRDTDDVNFVALNISLNSHGVLTKDKDISDLDEVKTWELGDAGRVITEVNKGAFSFLILNQTVPPLFEIILDLVKTIWSGIITVVNGFIKLFTSVLAGSVDAIVNMPIELAVVFGIMTIFVVGIKELRERAGEVLSMIWKKIKELIVFIKQLFKAVWEVFVEIYEALKPLFQFSAEVLFYLTEQSNQAMEHLEQLEAERA